MGKKKIDEVKLIENINARKITYMKRKKGLVKKAMEISILCGQDIFMVMYDKLNNKIVIYRSSEELDTSQINQVFSPQNMTNSNVEYWTDTDYDQMKDMNNHHTPWSTKKRNRGISETNNMEDE